MATPQIAYVLLYRSPGGWRTTVAEVPRGLACGMLRDVPADSPFEVASTRFESMLREGGAITGELVWRKTKPEWWGADVIPGALNAEGATTD